MNNVIEKVVCKSLCNGCGICAGMLDRCGLQMNFNKYGEYVPVVKHCNDCGICLDYCPSTNAVSIKGDDSSPLGSYMKCFIGYSNIGEERINGSSGGMATRIAKALLDKGMVDGVIVVGKSQKKDRFFEPIIAKTAQEIETYAGSKYYPIEFSSVLRRLRCEDGRYAIMGVPCVVNGLRLAQAKSPYLGRKIKYLLGLVCGHNKNRNYTSALTKLSGISIEEAESISYRCKDYTTKASNYGFRATSLDGREGNRLNFQESIVNDLWCGRYFSLDACFNCKDLFGKNADISFMDAWLEPYVEDPKGTSIIVVRDVDILVLIKEMMAQESAVLQEIDEKNVIKSQQGALDFKQNLVNKRIFLINKFISDIFHDNPVLLKMYISLGWRYDKLAKLLRQASKKMSRKDYNS